MLNYMETAPWPYFGDDELKAVERVLRSGKVNVWTGQETAAFELEFAQYTGANYGLAVSNGTVSLDMALKVLGIGAGDEVVVTARSYFASAGSIALAGAVPVFADVDAESQNLSCATIERVLSPRTKAIIPVHLAGWPCDMNAIIELVENQNVAVIEDCAQAHGALIDGRHVGTYGEIGSFSFCQDKIMTTGGEGGMLTTNSPELQDKLWSLRDHGKKRSTVTRDDHPLGFRWLHESFGSNYRLTEMQSAIGRLQLDKLDSWRSARTRNASAYNHAFKDVAGLKTTIPAGHITHAYYKFYMFVEPEVLKSGWDRDRIMQEVVAHGVPCFSGACPEMYLEKAVQNAGFAPEQRLPVAKRLGETSLMLPVHPTLTPEHVGRTIEVMTDVMARAVA